MRRLFLAVLLCASATVPVLADDAQDCFQQKDPQLRIKGCSEIIQRNPNDGTAYHNRAVAYGLAGDLNHAIADYTKTIEITPDNAAAYDNRGRAYASKGDYTNAVADVTKASELVAKASTWAAVTKPKPPTPVATAPKGTASAPKTAVIPAKEVATAPKAKPTPPARNNVVKKVPEDPWQTRAVFQDTGIN